MKNVIVLTTVYNCEQYLKRCLHFIYLQTFQNWKCYILNDLSTDNSLQIAEEYQKLDPRFIVINNTEKKYQAGNYDQILRTDLVADDDIVIEVDGDDWLATNNAFEVVVKAHEEGYLITHGSFIYSDGRRGFSSPFKINQLRTTIANATHLRSWRAKLWKNIRIEDLMVNGSFVETAGDVFFMLPMLEMAGDDRILHIPDILYVYNESNPLNDHKVDISNQLKMAALGRTYPKYNRL